MFNCTKRQKQHSFHVPENNFADPIFPVSKFDKKEEVVTNDVDVDVKNDVNDVNNNNNVNINKNNNINDVDVVNVNDDDNVNNVSNGNDVDDVDKFCRSKKKKKLKFRKFFGQPQNFLFVAIFFRTEQQKINLSEATLKTNVNFLLLCYFCYYRFCLIISIC